MIATRSRPWRSSACIAPTATLLKMQKPIARRRSAWWPGGRTAQNALLRLAAHHQVGRQHDRAGGVLRRVERVRIQRGVGIEVHEPLARARALDLVDVVRAVDARELLARGGRRRVMDQVAVEPGGDQPVADRRQPVRALRVVGPHVVQEARRMGDVGGGHAWLILGSRRPEPLADMPGHPPNGV